MNNWTFRTCLLIAIVYCRLERNDLETEPIEVISQPQGKVQNRGDVVDFEIHLKIVVDIIMFKS